MTLYLFDYNSYYDRKVQRFDTIQQYDDVVGGFEYAFRNMNFNPNDELNASIVVDLNGGSIPNYVLVYDEENQSIVSRWYIMNTERLKSSMYKFSLYRDVLADNLQTVLNAPCFIERAMIRDVNNNLILNKEGGSYNQIKVKETPLTDATKCPWIVGYVKRGQGVKTAIPTSTAKVDYVRIDDMPFHKYTKEPFLIASRYCIKAMTYEGMSGIMYGWSEKGARRNPTENVSEGSFTLPEGVKWTKLQVGYYYGDSDPLETSVPQCANAIYGKTPGVDWRTLADNYTGWHTSKEYLELLKMKDKVVQDGSNFYKITIDEKTMYGVIPLTQNKELKRQVDNMVQGSPHIDGGRAPREYGGALEYVLNSALLVLTPITISSNIIEIPGNHAFLDDAPYDMFCLPYGNLSTSAGVCNKERNLAAAMALSEAYSSNLLDLQLLPYCPLPHISSNINLSDYSSKEYTIYKTQSGGFAGVIWWCKKSTFSRNLGHGSTLPTNPIEYKVMNETDFYRLTSPNYNGSFEFKPTINGGVSSFECQATYKPFSPFIRVNPVFNRLYGSNFTDARGLICGGDFSLPQTQNAWVNYEINNKNYQTMFDRQIQNMETVNDINRTYETVEAVAGVFTSAGTGALTGAGIGGAVGAGIGAIGGAVLGGGAGIADIVLNEKLRKEGMSYAKDTFNLQIDNIKAIPNNLTKVSAFNAINKVFPVIEQYRSTVEERNALTKKIKERSMNVGVIGTINEYLDPNDFTYIKARPIKFNVSLTTNICNAIASELDKGVYV